MKLFTKLKRIKIIASPILLPKDITSYKVRKVLKIIESKVDEDED